MIRMHARPRPIWPAVLLDQYRQFNGGASVIVNRGDVSFLHAMIHGDKVDSAVASASLSESPWGLDRDTHSLRS